MPDSPARPGRPTASRERAPRAAAAPGAGSLGPPVRRGRAARRHARPAPAASLAAQAGLAARIGKAVLVVTLVAVALWLDRGRHDPVPAYGIIVPPGFTTYPALDSAPGAGDEAPTFLLPAIDGEIVALADHRGEVVVLHFWATWCLECRAEVPGLAALDAGDGVTVLGIAGGEPMSRVETTADGLDLAYPVLVDAGEEVAAAYGFSSYPATVVIDASGTITSLTEGPLPAEVLAEQVTAARAGD